MKKHFFTLLAAALPAVATEMPPMIPDGPVEYDTVNYDTYGYDPAAPAYSTPATDVYATAPMPAPSSEANGSIHLNVYTSNYQVRGMGFCNELTDHGFSSLSGSYTLPNRNYFNLGIQQRFSGEIGVIWGAGDPLGDTPLANIRYAVGKEIFPNLLAEIGTTFRRGGIEGFMAHVYDGCSHRATWEFDLSLTYNDKQRGFFGSASWGISAWGLTGSYFDAEIGYRFTDVISLSRFSSDLELSVGIAPSVGYWGSNIEGVDAYRFKMALCPFSANGGFGRDGRLHIKPWVQFAWSGSTSEKMANFTHYGPVDHFQTTVGVDLSWKF